MTNKNNREIDALVAEKIFGLAPEHFNRSQSYYELMSCGESLKYYSTSIADAWEVISKLKEYEAEYTKLFSYWISDYEGFIVRYHKGKWQAGWMMTASDGIHFYKDATADTAPMAICLAALKAKGVEV